MNTTKTNTTMDENFSFVRNSRGNFSSKSKDALKFLNRNNSGKIDTKIDFINLNDFHSNYGDDEFDEPSDDSFDQFINLINSTNCYSNTQRSPYRTLSHFGFQTPDYLQPNHFHYPVYPTKYIPIKRKATVDDLFSTERYLNCSDVQLREIWETKVRKSIYNPTNNTFEMSDGKRLKLSPPGEILEESKSDCSSDESSCDFRRIFENVLNDKRKKWQEKFHFENLDMSSTLVDVKFSSSDNSDNSDNSTDSLEQEESSNERDECSLFLKSVFDTVSQRRPSLERNKSLTTIDEEDETTLMKSNDENNNFIKEFIYEIVDQIPTTITHHIIEPSTTFIDKITEMNFSSESPNLDYEIERVPAVNKVLRRSPREIRKRKFMEMIDEHRNRSSESETEELNSIEKLILTKIEKNNFDRNEGSIFQKIEKSILSKIKSPIYTSSTPMEKSLHESFCSSTLSEVGDDWEHDFISGNATLRTKSKESGICDFEGSSDDDKIKSTTFIKDLTGLTISTTAKHSICPKLVEKDSPKTPRTPKRNFITENIRNVVLKKNFYSPRAGPPKKTVLSTPKPIKPLYSFKTKESKQGSPVYWLSASPRVKTTKSAGVRKITLKKPQQTVKDVIESEISDEIYQPDPDKPQNKICFTKDYLLNKTDEDCIQDLEEDMKKCSESVYSIGAHVQVVGTQIDDLKEKFNEILDLQKEIDEERTEFRQSISDVQERFESLVFTSTEDEDLLN